MSTWDDQRDGRLRSPGITKLGGVDDVWTDCQMLLGCSTTVAAYRAGQISEHDDGTHFLIWFMEWLEQYLQERRKTFENLYTHKRQRLGDVTSGATVA